MEVGKIEQLTDGKKTTVYSTADLPHAPRVYTFARQEQEIKRLQSELDAANASILQWMEWYHDRIAELDAANVRIVELTKALDTMNERQRQEWARAENAEAWAQAAYTRLSSLMTIGVSMTPDAVTKRLLEDAPESVKGGTQ